MKIVILWIAFLFFVERHEAFRIGTSRTPIVSPQLTFSTTNAQFIMHSSATSLSLTKTSAPVLSAMTKITTAGVENMPIMTPIIQAIKPVSILQIAVLRTTLKGVLKRAHKCQAAVQSFLSLGQPYEWDRSILGFLAEKGEVLTKIMALNYLLSLSLMVLAKLGVVIPPGMASLLSRSLYSLFATHVIEQFCGKFVSAFYPALSANKRQRYWLGRAASACVRAVQLVTLGGMVSTFLKVPLKTVLAAGGVGGLVLGLSARDIAANLLGGLTLLVNEPFTPGDFVSFKTGGAELVGRVESIGWGQTCVRCKDTRPVYVPNSHFVAASVTNLERITHRKFETTIQLRHQDFGVVTDVVAEMRERLRTVAKLDPVAMPFRVSFARVGPHSLDVEVLAYFSTRSLDEFTMLQQAANIELLTAVERCGAKLALPSSIVHMSSGQQVAAFSHLSSNTTH